MPTHVETAVTALPLKLRRIAGPVPAVGALAELVRPGSARWSYGCIARDLVGPDRSEVLFSELAMRGAPARAATTRTETRMLPIAKGERRLVSVEIDVPAAEAVVAVGALLDGVGDWETLSAYVEHLDGLSGQEPTEVPDTPQGWVVRSWAGRRTELGGGDPPPLRWSAPRGGARRPELAALHPASGGAEARLVGLARAGAPHVRDTPSAFRDHGVGVGVLCLDARLLAVLELARHAVALDPDANVRGAVETLAGWVVGWDRARPSEHTLSSGWGEEYAQPGARAAARELAQARPQDVVESVMHAACVHSRGSDRAAAL